MGWNCFCYPDATVRRVLCATVRNPTSLTSEAQERQYHDKMPRSLHKTSGIKIWTAPELFRDVTVQFTSGFPVPSEAEVASGSRRL
jgi:hypothetical protein